MVIFRHLVRYTPLVLQKNTSPILYRSTSYCLITCVSGFFLLTTPLLAEEQDDDIPQQLPSIEVIGHDLNRQKMHQEDDFYRSFNSDKVFSETLEQESIGDVKQAIKDLPNVHVVEQGAFTKQVEIRGFSGDRIQSVIDGVRLSNQGTTHAGGGELNLLDIAGVDSIEVIKGSPSVIYAPGAAGGVINVKLKPVPNTDSVSSRYVFNYDDGYEKTKHSALFSGAWKGLGANLIYSTTDASDYKVRNKGKLAETILRTNVLDEREGTDHEIKNLGYSDKSWQARLQYKLNDHHRLYYAFGDYKGKDIAFTHGAATSQVFFYDNFDRQSHLAGYELNDIGIVDQLSFTYSNQAITRGTFQGLTLHETVLESNSFQLKGVSHLGTNAELTLGAEYTQDEAETQTLADQDYYAVYASLDYEWGDWSFSTGLRGNFWTAKQRLIDHRNTDVIDNLVGVSGRVDDIDDQALTYAFGMIYSVTDTQNLSFNYSRTYRFPSLYERFAFDNFVGGGAELNAEKGHNFDWAWKYMSDPWFAKVSLFYSTFDSYLGTVLRRKLTNPQALVRCIEREECNPAAGNYDDRENDFFSSTVNFENLGQVTNKGFEMSTGIIKEGDYEAGFNIGLNDIEADNVFAEIDSNPLELSAHYKKTLNFLPLKPWVKIKARYVTDWPKINQKEGFNSFFTADAYLGVRYEYAKKVNFAFNFGVRNLTDEVYHEAFSALDGVKRTVFGNLSLQIKFD